MITRHYDAKRQAVFTQCHVSDLPGMMRREIVSEANASRGSYPGSYLEQKPDWYGGLRTMAEAEALFTDGWQDGAARLQRMAEEIQAPVQEVTVVRRRMVQADQGDTLDGWRAMAGDWDVAWDAQTQRERNGPRVVTIGTDWVAAAVRNAEELFWSGAQVAVAADLLERAGYVVEILAITCVNSTVTNGQDGRSKPAAVVLAEVTIKKPEEPLRIDQIAAVLCHAGSYRTAGFGFYYAAPFDVGGGLGMCSTAKAGYAAVSAVIPEAVLPRFVMPSAYDRKTAEKNIAALVAELEAAAGGDA